MIGALAAASIGCSMGSSLVAVGVALLGGAGAAVIAAASGIVGGGVDDRTETGVVAARHPPETACVGPATAFSARSASAAQYDCVLPVSAAVG